jgi:hypothetical protein
MATSSGGGELGGGGVWEEEETFVGLPRQLRGQDGNLVGKLTTGEVSICRGTEIDGDGEVVNSKGTTIGHLSLIQDIPELKESPEEKEKRE